MRKPPTPAALYDARTSDIVSDLAFSKSITKGGSVLEVGCGTGRILDAISEQSDTSVWGIDIDRDKIDIAEVKLRNKDIDLIDEDFLKFGCSQKFDTILFAFNVLAEFIGVNNRISALTRAREMITPDGKIVIILHMHDFDLFSRSKSAHEFKTTCDGETWSTSIECTRSNVWQRSNCQVRYTRDSDGIAVFDRYTTDLITRNEMLATIQASGLVLRAEYGSYAFTEIDEDSKTMIFVVGRP